MFKGYILYSRGSEGNPDAIVVAGSIEEAVRFLGAKLQVQVHETKWEIVFPVSLFDPPALGSKEELDTEGMWRYQIPSQGGRGLVILLNLEGEVEVAYFLEELPLLMPSSR